MTALTPYQALGKAIVAAAAVKTGGSTPSVAVHQSFQPVIDVLLPPVGDNTILHNFSGLISPETVEGAARFAELDAISTAASVFLRTPAAHGAIAPAELPAVAAGLRPFRHVTTIIPESTQFWASTDLSSLWIAVGALQAGGSVSALISSPDIAMAFFHLVGRDGRFGAPITLQHHTVPVENGASQYGDLFVVTATKAHNREPGADAIRAAMQIFRPEVGAYSTPALSLN